MEYKGLTVRAKVNCLDIFVNGICAYDDGEFDSTKAMKDLECSVEQVLETGNWKIDEDGNWLEA